MTSRFSAALDEGRTAREQPHQLAVDNGGTPEKAAQMASHASTCTMQLYDHRREELSLDEVERIRL
jgi:hypothetical protein